MELLWITPKWPFPVADGARMATTQLLKNLTAEGIDIHLCCLVPEDEVIELTQAKLELGVNGVTLIRRPKSSRRRQLLSLFTRPFFPVTLAPYAGSAVRQEIEALLLKHPFDFVVYDGLHAAAFRLDQEGSRLKLPAEAYRAHNVESDIWFRGAKETRNPLKKVLLKFQGSRVKKLERDLVLSSRHIFPVSTADEMIFKTYGTRGKFHTVPIGIQVPRASGPAPMKSASEGRKILFVGKLDWPPNRDGLRWVLENAWPKAHAQTPDLSLNIVGSGERGWLEAYRHLPGVNIIGQVESLTPYYADCIATLVPVFYGSGTRVKAIESSLHGRVCLSTAVGVEGVGLVPGESYVNVESAEEWINALVHLKSSEAIEMGKRAQAYTSQVFDPKLIARNLIQKIASSPVAQLTQ